MTRTLNTSHLPISAHELAGFRCRSPLHLRRLARHLED
jgi:hypothetical protein